MQDILVQHQQNEAIRHATKPVNSTKSVEECESSDEFSRLTIGIHLGENVYLSMAKEKTSYELQES